MFAQVARKVVYVLNIFESFELLKNKWCFFLFHGTSVGPNFNIFCTIFPLQNLSMNAISFSKISVDLEI